ncbi:hypothetical protein SAMN05660690_1495 [Geodermatophilus telluris]|uniref:Transposase DDE domain-containing protein n=1 Tax=Geodermatophilus telluris TaxID=1190417 RepID=A0A1G6LPR1_9ACTN|nr:hypothetical protein [Geodermatophilus telluris]SDC45250.1 hypothetical protein SAMN05660690_1495 [Geodermatophilus telluris]
MHRPTKPAASGYQAQFTANSPATPFLIDDRPALIALPLAGPRRKKEGRGGATANLVVFRTLIRSPLLPAFTAALPRARGGRPTPLPDLYWVFYGCAMRELASNEQLDQELPQVWTEIRKEFWFEHRVLLPDALPNGEIPGGSYSYRKWRKRRFFPEKKTSPLPDLVGRLTDISIPLALAVRAAEGGDVPRELIDPAVWDIVAIDGTVLNAPSDVRQEQVVDDNGEVVRDTDGNPVLQVTGSRAKKGRPRVHHDVTDARGKEHGAKHGLYNVVATTKGLDTYTRVVLGLDIGDPGEGEDPVAMRVLRGIYSRAGHVFPVLTIDGVGKPGMYQDLVSEFGVYVVNPQSARARNKGEAQADPANAHLTGTTIRRYGVKKDQAKLTYDTPLDTVCHEVDGVAHDHHLVADDGAVYETDLPATRGSRVRKLGMLTPTGVGRRRDTDGRYYLLLTLTGSCAHGGDFTVTLELRWTKPVKDGRVPWRSMIANVRVIPEALFEKYCLTFGKRNQIESFFGWLEKRFYVKDRHASWGREAQLLDLVFSALLHNTEAWAHLAYRHPAAAADLARELADLPATISSINSTSVKEELLAA